MRNDEKVDTLKKLLLAAALLACAASSPALARYGFQCTVTEHETIFASEAAKKLDPNRKDYVKPPRQIIRTFIIENGGTAYRRRFLGADSVDTGPIRIEEDGDLLVLGDSHKGQLGMYMPESGAQYVLIHRMEGTYYSWTSNSNHSIYSEGQCREVTDIPDTSIPGLQISAGLFLIIFGRKSGYENGSAAFRRQPQNGVAVAFARPAHGPQTGDDGDMVQPDQALAALVDLVLITHAAERERGGNRLEGGLGDGDADHAVRRLECGLGYGHTSR